MMYNSIFYLYNGSRVLDLFENKNILIYQSVFSQILASLCHSGLITLSQTNQFNESCIVIILDTLNLINQLFGTDSFCPFE